MSENGQVVMDIPFSPSSSSLAHFKAYPLVNDILSILKQYTLFSYLVTYSKESVSSVSPYLSKVPYLSLSLHKVDLFVDNTLLTKFDQIFPPITKITTNDLKPSSLYDSAKSAFYKRYHNFTESVVKRVHSIEDRTRPAVLKRIDPLVSPVNNTFETLINQYLPESPKIDGESNKDELARLFNLTSSAYKKSIPLVTSTKDQVIQMPHDLSSHINGVYQEELSSSKTSKEAFAKTSRKLSSEALQSLKPIVDPIFTRVENLRNQTHLKINLTIDTAKNNIDGFVEEVKHGVDSGTLNGSSSNSAPVATPVVTASA